jgi:hypothetical protein
MIMGMAVRFSLDDFLRARQITPYRLAKELEGRVARGSVFAMSKGEHVKRVDLESLSEIINALRAITAETVTFNDLFEEMDTAVQGGPRLSRAGVPYTGDCEVDAILDEHPTILDRLERLRQGNADLIPLNQVASTLHDRLDTQKRGRKVNSA